MNNNEIQFANPNLNKYITRLENKGQPEILKKEEKAQDRLRKFKKPLNLLAVRKERLDMVKGLTSNEEKTKKAKAKGNKLPGDDEPSESTMTHDEIRQWHNQYHISW